MWAQANERAQVAEVYERSRKVRGAFSRLSRCATRGPAKHRRLLDEKLWAALKRRHADLKVIENLLSPQQPFLSNFQMRKLREPHLLRWASSDTTVGCGEARRVSRINDHVFSPPARNSMIVEVYVTALRSNLCPLRVMCGRRLIDRSFLTLIQLKT